MPDDALTLGMDCFICLGNHDKEVQWGYKNYGSLWWVVCYWTSCLYDLRITYSVYNNKTRLLPECIIPTLQGITLHVHHGDINEMCSCWFIERDTDFHLLIKWEESGWNNSTRSNCTRRHPQYSRFDLFFVLLELLISVCLVYSVHCLACQMLRSWDWIPLVAWVYSFFPFVLTSTDGRPSGQEAQPKSINLSKHENGRPWAALACRAL
jgi:hypothetical protein